MTEAVLLELGAYQQESTDGLGSLIVKGYHIEDR